MIFLKKYWRLITLIIFFIGIYVASILPLRDFDIWFHLKAGEIFLQKGIIHYDVFSHSAQGREWFPYEWLYQVIVYFIQQFLGIEAIKYFNAGLVTLMIFFLYKIFKDIFKSDVLPAICVCLFFFSSIYEFFTARPHILAYTFLIIVIYLIFLYLVKNRNLLWISIPITWAWANMHGSIFLDIALFGAYAIIALIYFHLYKDKAWLKKSKTLALYMVGVAIVSILPPIGFTQYKLLWIFYQHRTLISQYIGEWTPLSADQTGFTIYTITAVIVFGIWLLTIWSTKKFREILLLLPLLPFPFIAYVATRNVVLGYITMSILLIWSLSQIHPNKLSGLLKAVFFTFIIGFSLFSIWLIGYKHTIILSQKLYYPTQAAGFIKDHLKGNMFNEYGYGGYLLYRLYPEQKVLFDGRTDIYLCCEIPDTMEMAKKKNLSDAEYKKLLDRFWDKYHISFVVARTEKNTILRKMTRILTDDPNWSLVFWDDVSQIFVRHDGKNDDILRTFGTTAATPYSKDPYRNNQTTQALNEYLHMIQTVDSARSRNVIGSIYLQQKKYSEAQDQFKKAIALDPTFESPYMNLAWFAIRDGDDDTAIELYKKAMNLAPDRGLIYINLGKIYLKGKQDPVSAKNVWQLGLRNTVDTDAKKQLEQLISQY